MNRRSSNRARLLFLLPRAISAPATFLMVIYLTGGERATRTANDSGRFVDRWIQVQPRDSHRIWTAGLQRLELPVANGEGKFVPADESVRRALWDHRQVALVYANDQNPNGSIEH